MIAALLSVLLPFATVEQRELDTEHTVHINAGGVWLSRFDLHSSPGVTGTLTHYLTRTLALDYLNASYFFTSDLPEAARLYTQTGYQSDREKPRALIGVGGRYGFAYGKMLIEAAGSVVRFVPELSLHVGAMITDTAVHPAFDVGLGLRIQMSKRLNVSLEYLFVGSIEGPGTRFVAGGMPKLTFGLVL